MQVAQDGRGRKGAPQNVSDADLVNCIVIASDVAWGTVHASSSYRSLQPQHRKDTPPSLGLFETRLAKERCARAVSLDPSPKFCNIL